MGQRLIISDSAPASTNGGADRKRPPATTLTDAGVTCDSTTALFPRDLSLKLQGGENAVVVVAVVLWRLARPEQVPTEVEW